MGEMWNLAPRILASTPQDRQKGGGTGGGRSQVSLGVCFPSPALPQLSTSAASVSTAKGLSIAAKTVPIQEGYGRASVHEKGCLSLSLNKECCLEPSKPAATPDCALRGDQDEE